MNEQFAVVATIRPGKHDQLARLLAQGPPFEVAAHGFTSHHAFSGERTVVFVFEGTSALERVQELRRRLPMTELARMGLLVHDPELLTDRLSWEAATDGVGHA